MAPIVQLLVTEPLVLLFDDFAEVILSHLQLNDRGLFALHFGDFQVTGCSGKKVKKQDEHIAQG
jgi:hypothetical protein